MTGNGFKDITGQHFGRLTVIERDYNYPFEHNLARKTSAYWKCKCDCGNIITVRGTNLRNGKTKSCGCLSKEKAAQRFSEMNRKNISQLQGKTFGYLTALYPLEERKHGAIVWHCQCKCGNTYDVRSDSLVSGHTISCGCIKSLGEYQIEQILIQNNIKYEKQKSFEDLRGATNNAILRYDFYLPEYNRLIEFDGEQHFYSVKGYWNGAFSNLEIQKERDNKKNIYAKNHNISLVRIPYWKRNNITLEMILGNQYLIEEKLI